MSSDILRIIEGGLNNDRRKIISYSNRLATRLEAEGNIQLARCISDGSPQFVGEFVEDNH